MKEAGEAAGWRKRDDARAIPRGKKGKGTGGARAGDARISVRRRCGVAARWPH